MTLQSNTYTHCLANGLQIVHIHHPATTAAWMGVAVDAGSRDETTGQYGLAHFVEHTLFKGTTHRRAWHILNRMETVGGELNAYTTKENTFVYSIFPYTHLSRAVELIADLVKNASFPEHELQREREVVLEEVASYRDMPSEAIFDDFEDLAWQGSTLGHNILGQEEDLRNLHTDDCQRWVSGLYVPQNMVIFSLGPYPPERVFRLLDSHFGTLDHPMVKAERSAPKHYEPQHREVRIDSHQCHVMIGAPVPGFKHEQTPEIALLANIIAGQGMNSMLNVQLRERRGYVYSVEANYAALSDCGLLELYFACDPGKLTRSRRIVQQTIDALCQSPLSERQLTAWKKQHCGQLMVAANSAENTILTAAKQLLYHGRITSLSQSVEQIMDITAERLRTAATLLRPASCSSITFY